MTVINKTISNDACTPAVFLLLGEDFPVSEFWWEIFLVFMNWNRDNEYLGTEYLDAYLWGLLFKHFSSHPMHSNLFFSFTETVARFSAPSVHPRLVLCHATGSKGRSEFAMSASTKLPRHHGRARTKTVSSFKNMYKCICASRGDANEWREI